MRGISEENARDAVFAASNAEEKLNKSHPSPKEQKLTIQKTKMLLVKL